MVLEWRTRNTSRSVATLATRLIMMEIMDMPKFWPLLSDGSGHRGLPGPIQEWKDRWTAMGSNNGSLSVTITLRMEAVPLLLKTQKAGR